MKKKKLNENYKIILFIIIFLISIVPIIKLGLFFMDSTVKDSITYSENGSLNYSVCLYENEFITNQCFNEKRSFVTNLINYIKIDYKYQFDTSHLINYNYNYKITADVIATEKYEESKIVYSEQEVLDGSSGNNLDSNSYYISTSSQIDYQKYNNLITNFKKNYILSLDSKLIITFDITINGSYEGVDNDINEHHQMKIEIPLSEQTVDIVDKDTKIKNSKTYIQEISNKPKFFNTKAFDLLFVFVITTLMLTIGNLIRMLPKKSRYDKKIHRVFKDYDKAIVKVKKMPPLDDYKLIEVETFEEMLDARDNLEKPILFCENKHIQMAAFIIINNKEAYVYIMRADEK